MGVIRLLLAISVVIAHSEAIFGFRLVGGQVAVQAFYIISGFYMAMILNEKYTGKNSYKLFISNRLLRLYPVYWTVLILTLLFFIFKTNHGALELYVQYFNSMDFSSFIFLVFTNLFMFFQDIVMFLGFDTTTGNIFFTTNFREVNQPLYQFLFVRQAWTIGVELMFYLIVPFLFKRKTKYIIALICCSLLLRLYLVFGLNLKNDPWTYRFFPTELMFFLAGILAYRGYRYWQRFQIKEKYLKIIWIGILFLTVIFSFLPYKTFHSFIIKDWLYLFVFFIALPFIFSLTKKWKLDRYIGELSYPVYISHILILSFVKYFCNCLNINYIWGGGGNNCIHFNNICYCIK